ncbi:hypothetical protein COLO4_17232 [Corchorus olitorius]|uniref:KIB1-4 beta-propeller domain-containing protein n=1 Tax=Corchorus olitorius TaxID=93759 RepID=A0A1R3JDG9_9ROSI|nr:hypothetical protein COLO4_17232 [Corchorus olitorius]
MPDFRFPKSNTKIGKQLVTEEENVNETHVRHIFDLPLHILELIAEKLYLVDYINFRSVCNAFRLVPHIKWRQVSSNNKFQYSQLLSPWLIFPKHTNHPSYAIHNLFDPHLGGLYTIQIHEPPLDAKIRYSKNGWLLMSNHNSIFIYHPFVRTGTITLREAPLHCFGYALSSLPPTPRTILVASGVDAIYYFCSTLGYWSTYRCNAYDDFVKIDNSPIIFLNGVFYFLSGQGKLGAFWLMRDTGGGVWKTFRSLKSPRPCFRYNYLAEFDGQLLSIFTEDDQSVHIYKLINFTEGGEWEWGRAWEKVTSLGDYALFVSCSSAFSVIPNSSDMKNRIYFSKLFGRGIVYYCLSTHKFYTTENNQVVQDFYNTTEFLHSTWIQPWW